MEQKSSFFNMHNSLQGHIAMRVSKYLASILAQYVALSRV